MKFNDYLRAISLATLCLLCLPSVSFATNFYVHAGIGDNANGGAHPDDAFSDLKFAMKKLRAGDTLHVRSGTYREVPILSARYYRSGTQAQPIVVKRYNKENAVISSSTSLFIIRDLSWWVFEDLTFQNSGAFKLGGAKMGECKSITGNIMFLKNRFQHSTNSAIKIQCARDIEIKDNIFDNLRRREVGKSLHAVQLLVLAEDVIISRNVFRDIGGDGIQVAAEVRNIEISSNTFEVVRPYTYRDIRGNVDANDPKRFGNVGDNAIDIRNGPGPIQIVDNKIGGFRPNVKGQDLSKSNGIGIVLQDNASGVSLRRNHFYDNIIHLKVIKGAKSDSDLPPRNTELSNNIFDELAFSSDRKPTALELANVSDIRVYNNTLHDDDGSRNRLLRLKNVSNIELHNNLFYNGIIKAETASSYIMDVYADHNAWSGIKNEIDPLLLGFNDLTVNNPDIDTFWVPREGSPLIDAGTAVGTHDDFYGAPVAGLNPDIGAVESGSQPTAIVEPPASAEPQFPSGEVPDIDTQAPVITINAPGGSVSGIVKIRVVAEDAGGIDTVQLLIDDSLVSEARFTSDILFNWDSSPYADSFVRVTAVAIDLAGNRTSEEILLNVAPDEIPDFDTQPPVVSIIVPSSSTAGIMEILVEASDPDGINRVKLYINDVHFGGDLSAPYKFTWDSSAYAGRDVRIRALAIDNLKNRNTDEIILAVADDKSSTPVTPPPEEDVTPTPTPTTKLPQGNAKLLFTSDFETGALQNASKSHDGWGLQDGGISGAAIVQKNIVRAGKYAVRSYLEKADWDGTNQIQGTIRPRTQLMKSNKYVPIQQDTEYWIGVSSFIPKNWVNETNEKNVEVLWQIHPSGNVSQYSPPLVLHIRGDKMHIRTLSGDIIKGTTSRELWQGDIEKGKWVDWVVRFNLSLEKGYVQVWKNGEKIADFSGGPNMIYKSTDVQRNPLFFTMGIYKPKFVKARTSVISHTIYWDELRIAKGTGGKGLVTPPSQ